MVYENILFKFSIEIQGAFHDNFPGFSGFGFSGNLCAQKIIKAKTKQANITGIQYNSWVSTGNGVNFLLSFLLLSLCDNSHIPPFDPLSGGCQLSLMPRSATEIPYPIWIVKIPSLLPLSCA